METLRQYALEKLGEAREADKARDRHRDHYMAMVAVLDDPFTKQSLRTVEHAEAEFDNLRTAFGWSHERNSIEEALRIASSLQPLWLSRGRNLEGLSWFHAILPDEPRRAVDVTPAVHARALADKATLAAVISDPDNLERGERALAMAREIGEPGLLLRALTACGSTAVFLPDIARPYLAEALELARALGDTWRMSQVLWWQAFTATCAGEPAAALEAGYEGSRLAADIGDPFVARMCRFWGIGTAQMMQGEFTAAAAQYRELIAEAEASHDPFGQLAAQSHLGHALAHMGDTDGARAAAVIACELGAEFGGFVAGIGYAPLARAALAAGDVAAATVACEVACEKMGTHPIPGANVTPIAEIALARGDLAMARRFADETVSVASGFNLSMALVARTRVAIAEGDSEQAHRDAHKALAVAAAVDSHAPIPETLECLAALACDAESHFEAARLFGAAAALRHHMGIVRFRVYNDAYRASVTHVRNTLTNNDFESAWAEGSAMSISDVIAYAQRGRGERKRPSSGWASLTPTELDVVRLISEGLANKDIATRLFISPRTVATHLTHVYAKLGLTSRVQLAQEAARHA